MVEITSCVALRMAHLQRTGQRGEREQGVCQHVEGVDIGRCKRSVAKGAVGEFSRGLRLLGTSGDMAHIAASYGRIGGPPLIST
ncbi:hypothetical protein WM22_09365 [Burkholderia ubonensis]|nr:hypothetical protein WM19_06870 [Burkholderia ubonensis]KWN05464.1 hypothetical protein WM20_03880 [Burkholderia ubonensis]KWN39563.1 hypothetical protein WM22_09365 [Burkholderia ubonensis]